MLKAGGPESVSWSNKDYQPYCAVLPGRGRDGAVASGGSQKQTQM